MPGLITRRYNIAWIGLTLAIMSTAWMVFTYLIVNPGPADPNSHTQREADGCARSGLLLLLAYPAMLFTMVSCSVGLFSLVDCMRNQKGLFASIATLVLSIVSFILFDSM